MTDWLRLEGLPLAPGLQLRMAWIGGVSRYPASGEDFLVDVALRGEESEQVRFVARVALGDLVHLFPGTVWQEQRRLRLRRRTERHLRLDLSRSNTVVESKRPPLALMHSEGQTDRHGPFVSECLVTHDEDGEELLMPCFEVLRAFYAPSTAFFRRLVSGPSGSDLPRLLTKQGLSETGQPVGLHVDPHGRVRIQLADDLVDTKRNRQIAAHLCLSDVARREVHAMQVGFATARQAVTAAGAPGVVPLRIWPPFEGPASWTVRGEWKDRPSGKARIFHVYQILDCDFVPAFTDLVLDDLPPELEEPQGGGNGERGPGGGRRRRRRRKPKKLSSRQRPTNERTTVTEYVQNLPTLGGLDAHTSRGERQPVPSQGPTDQFPPRPVDGSTLSPTGSGPGKGGVPVDLQGVPPVENRREGQQPTDWPLEWFERAMKSLPKLIGARINVDRDPPCSVSVKVFNHCTFIDVLEESLWSSWFFVSTEPVDVERRAVVAVAHIGGLAYLLLEVERRTDRQTAEAYPTFLCPFAGEHLEPAIDQLLRAVRTKYGKSKLATGLPAGIWTRLHPATFVALGPDRDCDRTVSAIERLASALAESLSTHWLRQPGNALVRRARKKARAANRLRAEDPDLRCPHVHPEVACNSNLKSGWGRRKSAVCVFIPESRISHGR